MFLIWRHGLRGPSAFKCHEIPTNGSNQPQPYIGSPQPLTAAEFTLPISVLERIYPAPKESEK
jgi:hypothetical protein